MTHIDRDLRCWSAFIMATMQMTVRLPQASICAGLHLTLGHNYFTLPTLTKC